jgi:hypothetical protein
MWGMKVNRTPFMVVYQSAGVGRDKASGFDV